MPTTYPTEIKAKIIRRYEKGEAIKALSQELHISQSTLYQWRKEYCSIKTSTHAYTPKEFDAISRWLQKLEHHMETSARPDIYPIYPCRRNSLPLKDFTTGRIILTASMSYAMLLMLQERLSAKITYQGQEKPQNLTFHSDRGSQYVSKKH